MKTLTDNLKDLNLDKILRRPERKEPQQVVPTELYQVAVFYSVTVIDELKFMDDEQIKTALKEVKLFQKGRTKFALQNAVELAAVQFENQRFVFPYYSREIFLSEPEARNFIPIFIKQMIKQEILPEDIILEDNSVDEDRVQISLVPLTMTFLEKEQSEFKDR